MNLDKTNVMKFTRKYTPQHTLSISCKEECKDEIVNTKFIGLQIDDHLIWKNSTD
jgi:hypothetical protein